MMLAAHYLGGGFTSQLMREVRVKKGLTYSISAVAAAQKNYGRAVISTFTPNQKISRLIKVIRQTLDKSTESLDGEALKRSRGNLIGSYPFQFESSSQFLSQMMILKHKEKSLEALVNFPEKIKDLTSKQIKKELQKIFDFQKQTIVILGSEKLQQVLRKAGISFKKVSYKKFL